MVKFMKNKTNPIEGKSSIESKKKKSIAIVLAGLAIIVIGSVWVGVKYWKDKSQLLSQGVQEALTADEKEKLLAKIGKHILILTEEEPLIIKINNAEQLMQQQAFFQYSQNEDILLVYQDKALIYRPGEDVLINVGPVYITNPSENE